MAKVKKFSHLAKEDLKKKMLEYRVEAEDGNKPAFIRMTENERFKVGQQWDAEDTDLNEAHGKFSLTVNEILPIVLDIAGTEEENPMDYRVKNTKGGSQTIAEILSSLTKNVMDNSNGQEEGSRSFEAGITNARGFLRIIINYDKDPVNGDITIEEVDPFMVLPDPTCKCYDYNKEQNGAKYIIVDEWEDKEKLEAQYPGKKQELKAASFDFVPQGRFQGIMSRIFGGAGPNLSLKDDYRHYDESTWKEEMESNVTKQANNYRVSTYWHKEWKKGIYLQKLDDPLNLLPLWEPKDIKFAKNAAEKDDNLKVIDKDKFERPLTVPVLMKTVMVGDVFLYHIEDPFDGMNMYPIVRFAPYFDHGYEYPPVENLKGPQKLINFTFSGLVNILKNLANSGWKVGKTTEKWREWLEEHSGRDGLIIPMDKFGGQADKIDATDYPTGYDILTERGKQNMREISQVQLDVPVRKAESGRALAIREHQSLKTKGIIFRNWKNTNVILARTLVEIIRSTRVFSDEEILAVMDEEDMLDEKLFSQAIQIVQRQLEALGVQLPETPEPPNPVRIRTAPPALQAEMLDAYQREMKMYGQFAEQVEQAAVPIAHQLVIRLLRKMQIGRYDTKAVLAPMSPTMRTARRIETLELDKQLIEGGRIGISREMLIEQSDIQDKEKAIADGRQMEAQLAQQAAQ